MTKEQRQQSLVLARRACLMLTEFAIGQAPAIILNHSHRGEVASLLEEFGRLVEKERRQLEHVKAIAKKAGRPRSKKPSQFALAKRRSREKLKQQKPD